MIFYGEGVDVELVLTSEDLTIEIDAQGVARLTNE